MYLIFLVTLAILAQGSADVLRNITRFSGGDLFSLPGTECGPTRCTEVTHGTALSMMGSGCMCQCQAETPAFREDQRVCVTAIEECQMASFGRGATKPQIPFVFLPLKGQIIYPAKEIIFTDIEDAICVVTSAQYLSEAGWVTLRDVTDNDVPFGLYRDEGKTFLQWRGSVRLHARLEGRLVTAHVLCSSQQPARLAASCAAFRFAGANHNALLDVRSIPFHAGEVVPSESSTQSQGLSVLECLAIGVCVLMLIFVYAAGIVFYVHYKQRQRRKEKDPEMNRNHQMSSENGSTYDSRIDMDNIRLKTNPLLGMDAMGNDYLHDSVLSDVSEHTEDTVDSSPKNTQKFQKLNSNVISAMVHTRRKKPTRPSIRAASSSDRIMERVQRRSASPEIERAPHSDLSIIDCSMEHNDGMNHEMSPENTEPALRRKLYFNPVFFESEHLKNPPPAAIDFLVKIREVMTIAKDKMTSKRFVPNLSNIPEEELYHTIDLGWDIPCARRGRRFSAISLKRENSRRAVHCGGCPGCDSSSAREERKVTLTRSNSCKSCVSDDYKQSNVRKWLEEVPAPRPVKSVAKVSGTPRVMEQKKIESVSVSPPEPVRPITLEIPKLEPKPVETIVRPIPKEPVRLHIEEKADDIVRVVTPDSDHSRMTSPTPSLPKDRPKVGPKNICHATRKIRKRLPPPPPPPTEPPPPPPPIPSPVIAIAIAAKQDEPEPIPPEVKIKMEAVIKELNLIRRAEPIVAKTTAEKLSPKVAPTIAAKLVPEAAPKLVIPVVAADSHYYSDDNTLDNRRRMQRQQFVDMDSLERNMLKHRRFSVACGPELVKNQELKRQPSMNSAVNKETLTRSWRDMQRTIDFSKPADSFSKPTIPVNEIFINDETEPLYDNVAKPGPLTIQVRGSPVENRRKLEQFDPDTLDRKPKKEARVEKILLKSGGSFKYKTTLETDSKRQQSPPETVFNRKIGSLRQIYEAKAKAQAEEQMFVSAPYERRGSLVMTYDSDDLAAVVRSVKTPDLIKQIEHKEFRPPLPQKLKRPEVSIKLNSPRRSPEERERFPHYVRSENMNARRSGRRSNRTRSRRTDLRKLYRTEDSGYLSTDSNESKRRAYYLMQLKPRTTLPEIKQIPNATSQVPKTTQLHIDTDTDELESLCDGRSESGGESIETDSVFFGNFDESKQMLAELGYESEKMMQHQEQIDSGFAGETNIILSGDSDSEHRSVISIVAGCDGRASSASISNVDDAHYRHTVEC